MGIGRSLRVGRRVGGQLRVGIGDRWRDRGRRAGGDITISGFPGVGRFRCGLVGLASLVSFRVPRTLPGGFAGRRVVRFRRRRRAIGACRRDRRWPRETYDQPCRQYQGRAPAGSEFHVTVSPFCPPPRRNEPPRRDHSGAKKGNLRAGRAKAGQTRCGEAGLCRPSRRQDIAIRSLAGAGRGNRCYEPRGVRLASAFPKECFVARRRSAGSRLRDQAVPA